MSLKKFEVIWQPKGDRPPPGSDPALMSVAMIFSTILSSRIGEAICRPRKHWLPAIRQA